MPQPRLPPDLPDEILDELDAAQTAYEAAVEAERAAVRRRARAIVAATDAGLSRRQIGDRLGVTRGRVQQIIDAGR
jgi:DNA-directed RNA polymerase specialized sigma24 family protein